MRLYHYNVHQTPTWPDQMIMIKALQSCNPLHQLELKVNKQYHQHTHWPALIPDRESLILSVTVAEYYLSPSWAQSWTLTVEKTSSLWYSYDWLTDKLKKLVRAVCVCCHRTKCPLLTAFFSLSLSPRLLLLPQKELSWPIFLLIPIYFDGHICHRYRYRYFS